jgi:hypothetical protein
MKGREMGGQVVCIGEKRNAHKISIKIFEEEKKPL